jgi:CRISPR/Cas system-associated exonuclease Cas4 (RecB family)
MPIILPPAFRFSQSSLQDFVDCPRRFQLRYLLEQRYPAPAAEPLAEVERSIELGRRFHLNMERHWRGLPAFKELDPVLAGWWQMYQQSPPPLPGHIRRPEVTAVATLAGQRFTATFDLLAHSEDPESEVVIVDYKTTRRPQRHHLERRLQTVVYPLMLAVTADRLIGRPLKPSQITMIYWFADTGETEAFRYSDVARQESERRLKAIFAQLFTLEASIFPLTTNERMCGLCEYRSLCGRGQKADEISAGADELLDPDELREILLSANDTDSFVL